MLAQLSRQTFTGLRALLVFTLVLGLAYPLTMVLIATVVPSQDSALRNAEGEVVGSALMAQPVTGDEWFYPRPSAGLASGAAHLAVTNPELVDAIAARRADIAVREDVDPEDIPADAVTASASGLDPEISPEYARLQVARVARETGLSEEDVTTMVEDNTQQPLLGFIGEPRVNVVTLNNELANNADARVDVN